MTILYFTATGNNLYLAKNIGGNLVSIPRAVKEGNLHFSDEKIGIIFPIYVWSVPLYIREFLRKAKLDSSYIFAIMSFGMLSGAATSHLLRLGAENNICFSYINVIKMVDNYLPGFEMGKQIENEPKKQIDKHLHKIIHDINSNRQFVHKDSVLEKLISKQLLKADLFKTGIGITDKCEVEDSCTKCGICVKVCPVDNIQVADDKPAFGTTCISCLACTQNCPQNAIRLTNERSKVRFRNKHITLSEIIESNS